MILIVASDYETLYKDLCKLIAVTIETARNTTVYATMMYGKKVIYINGGCTKVDLTRNIVNVISKYPITKIIGIGNTATLCEHRACFGDILISTETLQYDVNFSQLGYLVGEIPDINKVIFHSDKFLIEKAKKAARDNRFGYKEGRCISADQFVACTKKANMLQCKFEAIGLDSECGTIGEIGFIYRIPVVTVKAISNCANNNAVCDYRANRNKANCNSLKVAYTMADCISKL